MDKTYSLDRIEDIVAVLIAQDGCRYSVLSQKLPPDVREGDVLALRSGVWTILHAETERLRAELFELQESLFDE